MGEATVICLDTSEWTRNCDFAPSRMDAQQDAASRICDVKLQSSPESTVALMSMTSSGVKVLVTLTNEQGKLMSSIYSLKPKGDSDFVTSLQIAQLALKHRQNERLRTRIIAFVASPITASPEVLEKLGNDLKKNGVALDIVNFGEESENTSKLETLINKVNNNGNSNLVTVPAGPHILADMLMTSPIFGEAGNAGGFGGIGGGFDQAEDPELAAAIRESMEMERARQAAESTTRGSGSGDASNTEMSDSAQPSSVPSSQGAPGSMEEDELLQAALAASRADLPQDDSSSPMEDDEEEQLRLAMEMSMAAEGMSDSNTENTGNTTLASTDGASSAGASVNEQYDQLFQDPAFINSLIGSVPGTEGSNAQSSGEPEKKKDEKKEDEKPADK